jgi:predicted MPP superfamily phosphohydrolase
MTLSAGEILAHYGLPFVGAVLGHGAVHIWFQNWISGIALPRPVLKLIRKPNFVCTLLVPFLVGYLLITQAPLGADFDVSSASGWQVVAAVYFVVCWVVGLGVAPALALWYWWARREPAQLGDKHTQTVDVTAALGYRPYGRGKGRLLARLPWNQIFQVDFVERTFHLPRLPAAWEGLSILHLSDLHLHGSPDRPFFEAVLERCRAWDCDLLALTGDIVDSKWHHRWVLPILGRLRCRYGAFAILGNHDSYHDATLCRRRLCRLGMEVLDNRWVRREVRGEPLTVIGHEGPWFRPAPDLSACPADGFRLCLSHTPDNLPWARRNGVDLMLAGHNHGGQIRFPLVGSVLVPSRLGRRFDCGSYYRAPTLLHVSRGLSGQSPLRYNCRPEVTRIELRRG